MAFCGRHGLHKTARRQGDHCWAQLHQRLARAIDDLARHGDAGEVALACRHRRAHPGVGRQPTALALNASDIDVQPGAGKGDMKGRRGLRMLQERLGQPRQGRQGRHCARVGDGAFLNRHEVPGATLLKSQPRALSLAALGGRRATRRREAGGAAKVGRISVSTPSMESCRRICSAFQAR